MVDIKTWNDIKTLECCPKNSEQVKEKTAVRGNNQFAYSDY